MADTYVCIKPTGYTLQVGAEADRYGNEYTSMSLAEAGEGGVENFPTGGDDLYMDVLHGSGANVWDGSPDTTFCNWDGWDCQNGSKVIVRTLTAAQAANGVSSRPDFSNGAMDTTEYLLQTTGPSIRLDNDDDPTEFLDIEFIGIQMTSSDVNDEAFLIVASAYHSAAKMEKCWIQHTGGDFCARNSDNSGVTLILVNSVLDGQGTADHGMFAGGTDQTTNLYNCTIWGANKDGGSNGVTRADGTVNVVNCIVGNNVDDFDGTFGGQYNCSDDGDGPGTDVQPAGGADDWTAELTTPWTNLTVKGGNIQNGSPISQADDPLVPADDIIGTARPTGLGTNVDIGAYQTIAVGGVAPTGALYGPLVGPMGGPI